MSRKPPEDETVDVEGPSSAPPVGPHARRMAGIEPFHVMALLARGRELEQAGRSIVHMEIGEPDFPSPEPVLTAAREAIAQGDVHYTPALGLPALREAIAAFYAQRHGVDIDPRRIAVTPGASGALLLTMGVLIERDAEVLLADPGYPCNRHFARFVEGHARSIPVGPETGYQLTPELVERHWSERTSAVLLASPANPTGTLVPPYGLARIASFAAAHEGMLIVDEIYQGLVYEEEARTALASGQRLFVINSFSKYFGMTGWRLGWLVAPEDYIDEVDRLAQNIFLAASTVAQHAALAALRPETIAILEQRREAFRERRDFLLPALRELGFDIPITPAGAFYLYAGCERFTPDSFSFATELLEQAGVAVTPGRDFGEHQAARHLRFAYTTSLSQLEEGVERLRRHLRAGG